RPNRSKVCSLLARSTRFNSADPFLDRKSRPPCLRLIRPVSLQFSRSLSRSEIASVCWKSCGASLLQFSRSLSRSEIHALKILANSLYGLQFSRSLSRSEMLFIAQNTTYKKQLQFSRSLTRSERRGHDREGLQQDEASIQP